MKRLLLLTTLLLLLVGCRREAWKTAEFALPEGVEPGRAVVALVALDRQTPPEVTVVGRRITVRYNTLRVARRNFSYTLEQLAPEKAGQ